MKKIINIALIAILVVFISSCEKLHELNSPDEAEVEYTPIKQLSGEWWVTYKFDDGSGVVDDYYGSGYTKILTYNTAANTPDSMWITDDDNFWQYRVKATCNPNDLTFSITDGKDLRWGDNTTISNAKVLLGGGVTKDGNVTDSIYMEIVWASDPTTVYQCSGVRRTGFLEDEY